MPWSILPMPAPVRPETNITNAETSFAEDSRKPASQLDSLGPVARPSSTARNVRARAKKSSISCWPKIRLSAQAGSQTDTQPGEQPGKGAGQGSRCGSWYKPGRANLAKEPGKAPGAEAGTQPGAQPGKEPGKGSGREAGTQPGAQPGKAPGAEAGTQPGAQPGKDGEVSRRGSRDATRGTG